MQNIVSFKQPKFKPMPGELTPAVINGATLPVKIGIAQRAIAACCDLSELLTWKDKLAALAAAAKMARMPEMARDVNRVHKEAIFRMGELLLEYGGETRGLKGVKRGPTGKVLPGTIRVSERTEIAGSAGIKKNIAAAAVRVARAPQTVRDRILSDDKIPIHPLMMQRYAPTLQEKNPKSRLVTTEKASMFFRGTTDLNASRNNRGLIAAASSLRATDLSGVGELTPEEKQRARKLVVEMQEILDDIDRRLGPA